MANTQLQFEEFLDPFWREGECGSFWEMVHQGVNSGEINRSRKKVHALYPDKREEEVTRLSDYTDIRGKPQHN